MTNKITDEVIHGAALSGQGSILSVGKFVNFCIGDAFQENADFLRSRSCDVDALKTVLKAHLKKEEQELSSMDQFAKMLGNNGGMMTPDFRKIMDNSKETAKKGERDIYFEDFLNSLYKLAPTTNKIVGLLNSNGYVHNPSIGIQAKGKYKALYELCEDLNEKAKNKRIDPLIGRKDEVQRIVEILAHYKKKNPLLVGPPGVGKTQIAEGLASMIEQNMVPDSLKNTKVFSLQVSAILAGTKFRGDFEERMKNVVTDI